MHISHLPEDLADAMRRQKALAGMAETEEVRIMHEALEQLYRSQMIAAELANRLSLIL